MKTIKVLGTGCPSCTATEALIKKVAIEQNIDVNILKISDIEDIMAYDVMSTPAVVIDEKVMIKGRVPSADEVKNLLNNMEEACCSDNSESCCSDSEKTTGSCCN